jgi:hypothetical protein
MSKRPVSATGEAMPASRVRPHPLRDFALDIVFGLALVSAGLAGFAWMIVTIGKPL